MGLIKDIAVETATNVIEDAAETAVVATATTVVTGVAVGITGIAVGVTGAVKGVAKGVQVVGKGVNATKNVVDKALDVTLGDKEVRHYKKEKKYLSNTKKGTFLIIQKAETEANDISIYDVEENLKYTAHGKLTSRNNRLSLLNDLGIEIGSVFKSGFAIRAPIFHEKKPANYAIEINGNEVAKLKTKISTNKEGYEVEPFGWTVKGSILKWDFSVNGNGKTIAHISKRKGYDTPTYFLDFADPDNEIIGLLIILTLIFRED